MNFLKKSNRLEEESALPKPTQVSPLLKWQGHDSNQKLSMLQNHWVLFTKTDPYAITSSYPLSYPTPHSHIHHYLPTLIRPQSQIGYILSSQKVPWVNLSPPFLLKLLSPFCLWVYFSYQVSSQTKF